jgi:mannosylglycerate hydrolase MGH1-like protein/glycosyl hydrolase family 63
MNAEENRLEESRRRKVHWKRWGPYVSERQWGTVREDYSPYGTAWDFFPHDHARSRTYRWGEDGIMGICDRHQLVCFAVALWNGRDPILKERLFGLTGNEGNHAEDVKEYYFYLDSTPTHSYMKALYKYPQEDFPYAKLVEENRRRTRNDFEYELLDSGVFDEGRYFDVFIEYAKASAEDLVIKISVINRGPAEADVVVLPTVWFRNTWAWGRDDYRPCLRAVPHLSIPKEYDIPGSRVIEVDHKTCGKRWLLCEGEPELLFTENETNAKKLFGSENRAPFVKDGINDYLVHGNREAVNPQNVGTKASAVYRLHASPGTTATLRLRLTDQEPKVAGRSAARLVTLAAPKTELFGQSFESVLASRKTEADEFYARRAPADLSEDAKNVQRQAFAGLLWSKQFYHFDVRTWLEGDPAGSPPPDGRRKGRNHEWSNLYNADVISMPDKWEYPWYAAWDLAFHCVPLAQIDPDFAKEQLTLLLREWYMHPNGQLPAYEWAFGDVNPPVHAWAAWRVYKIERRIRGKADRDFLESAFHKLLLNFTWWVNRKDAEGMNVFQGGFLGLDNIGVFDRSAPLPTGGYLEQSDGTSWMGMYCLNMLAIALELARENPAYENVASKFFEHFIRIANAMNNGGREGVELWDEQDGFYYDVLHLPGGDRHYLKVRSLVGLIPLLAVETFDQSIVDRLPGFKRRMRWFIDNDPDVRGRIEISQTQEGLRGLLSLANRGQLERILGCLLDEAEFLSPYGIRALSKFHKDHPYTLNVNGTEHGVDYEPAESRTGVFGGNSNWRGPVWFPINFLLIEALQKFHHFYGDALTVELPTGSGRRTSLWQAAAEISRRLTRIFLRSADGKRPVYGGLEKFQNDPHWRDCIYFYEFFHGDNGAGLGASHQTGWTALVAKLIEQSGAGM